MTNSSIYSTPENMGKIMSVYEKYLSRWPEPFECINVPTRYGNTHIIINGPKDAPPIVLLHGQGGTATMWLPNIIALSRDYRTYAIDTIGDIGKSELNNLDKYPKNGQAYSDWLVDIFNELDISQAFIIGLSMGGWLTMNLSVYAPERVKKIVLLGPAGISSVFTTVFHIIPVSINPSDANFKKYLHWAIGDNPLVHDAFAEYIVTYFKCKQRYAWPKRFSNEMLSRITVPTLLFIGRKDATFKKEKDIDRAAKMIPNVQLEIIDNCGHAMNIENADFVNNRTLDFLGTN